MRSTVFLRKFCVSNVLPACAIALILLSAFPAVSKADGSTMDLQKYYQDKVEEINRKNFHPGTDGYKFIYYPDFRARLKSPGNWYSYNETQGTYGAIYCTKESIGGLSGRYFTGLKISRGIGFVMGKDFKDFHEFFEFNEQALLKNMLPRKKVREFNQPSGFGSFRCVEFEDPQGEQSTVCCGYLKTEADAFTFVAEAPYKEWAGIKDELFKIVQSLQPRMSGEITDEVSASVMDNSLAREYIRNGPFIENELRSRLSKLKLGMSEQAYKDKMGFKSLPYGDSEMMLTTGWLNREKIAGGYRDNYGTVLGGFRKEIASIEIEDGKVAAIRDPYTGFGQIMNTDKYENFLANVPINQEYLTALVAVTTENEMKKENSEKVIEAAFTDLKVGDDTFTFKKKLHKYVTML